MDNSIQTSDIDCKAKSLCTKGAALCLVGSEGVIYYELLKPVETVNAERYRQQMMDLNQVLVKNNQNIKQGNTKRFCFMVMHHRTQQNRPRKRLSRLVGKYFRMRLTYQTWPHPITTYLHRWDMHLLSNTSLLTKMYKNGSMIGLP